MITLDYFLILSAILFGVGIIGVVSRRNPLIVFMSIELMLNAVNLSFVAFSKFLNNLDGQIIVFLVISVAAVEVAIGLAIIIAIFRHSEKIDIDEMNLMKW